ncbi:MAG: hypothetical protein WAO12_06580 [Venatoribacter sp.]
MRFYFCVVLWFISPWLLAQDFQYAPTIAIEYPPYVTQTDAAHGESVNLFNQQLKPLGWQMHLLFLPPARAMAVTANNGDWMFSYFPPKGNIEAAAYIIEIDGIRYGFFRKNSDQPFVWQSLSELKGGRVAVIRSMTSGGDGKLLARAGMQQVFVDKIEQGILMLANDRVDYVLTAEGTGWYYIDRLNLDTDKFQFSDSHIRIYSHTVYYNEANPVAVDLIQSLRAKK